MSTPVVTAAVVALSLLGQPVAALLCAVQCHNHEAARMPWEDHCGSGGTRGAVSQTLTAGVAFCNHAVAVAIMTIERHQVLRQAQIQSPAPIASLRQLAHAPLYGEIHNLGRPGSATAPLPLRI